MSIIVKGEIMIHKIKDFLSWIKVIWNLPFELKISVDALREQIKMIERQQDIEVKNFIEQEALSGKESILLKIPDIT